MTIPAAMKSSALKKACVIRWNMPFGVGAESDAEEHVADLRHRRVRDHALDVDLDERDQAGEQERAGAEPGGQVGDRRRVLEERRACGRSGRRRR